jgi:hypothetical protein
MRFASARAIDFCQLRFRRLRPAGSHPPVLRCFAALSPNSASLYLHVYSGRSLAPSL